MHYNTFIDNYLLKVRLDAHLLTVKSIQISDKACLKNACKRMNIK